MSEAMWMAEVEQIGDDYAAGKIEPEEFRSRMKRLGFDPDEIDDHQAALDEDRDNGGEPPKVTP